MKRTPTTVRQTAPSPPTMLVPPTTIPASTVKASVVSSGEACALSTREVSITPASPAAVAADREGEDPDGVDPDPREPRGLRVAAGGVHVAPGGCRREQDADAATTAITISQIDVFTLKISVRARSPKRVLSKRTSRLPLVTRLEQPLTMNDIAERRDQRVDPEDVVTITPFASPIRRPAPIPRKIASRRARVEREVGRDHGREAVDRADREVDAAGDQRRACRRRR